MKNNPKTVAAVGAALALAGSVIVLRGLLPDRPPGAAPVLALDPDAGTAPTPTVGSRPPAGRYHCPMHPRMISDRPGDCPICGMRLVPIDPSREAAGSADGSADGEVDPAGGGGELGDRADVRIDARRRQLIGVRTSAVEVKPLRRTIRAVGRVAFDETRLHNVTTKVSGWVEKLYANATGQLVKAGDPLLTVYSPELMASAQEYRIALRAREALRGATLPSAQADADRLVDGARRRLQLFDLDARQIRDLEKNADVPRTMTLAAPASGHILTRNVTQGQRIEPDMNLLDIGDLSRVWVLAEIYEYELPFVRVGQTATVTLSYLPERSFEGTVEFVYPVVSETTRTVRVRIAVANPDYSLKPEMYADVHLEAVLGEGLTVPESAVVGSGRRDVVFVDAGEGRFVPREVTLGVRLPDEVQVVSGLAAGERIVTSGNFFVDSESKLKAALSAVTGETSAEPAPAGHAH